MYLIATDSGPINGPFESRELLLTPGERAEVLIRGERPPGRYRLINLPYRRFNMGMLGMWGGRGMREGRSTASEEPVVLATVQYRESGRSLPLPTRLVPVEPVARATEARQLVFSHGMMHGDGMVFTINGRTFDPERTDAIVKLGSVEEWEIVNRGGMMMAFDHPFHIVIPTRFRC